MESLELQVKSVDEAVAAACKEWNCSEKDVKTTILEEVPGLFGKKKLKVRVDRADAKPAKAAKPVKAPAKAKAAPAPEPEPEPEVEEVEAAPAVAEKPSRSRKAPAKATKAKAEPAAETAREESAPEPREETIATEEMAEEAMGVLRGLLEAGDLEAQVELKGLNGRYVNLELDGKDVVHLVGKQGEALNQLQYLANIMISRQLDTGVRVTLDGNNFRQRREEKLATLARSVAEQVLERGEEAVFDALPAFERRVVHKVLAEFDGVTTYSEGEEPNRHVVIAPSN